MSSFYQKILDIALTHALTHGDLPLNRGRLADTLRPVQPREPEAARVGQGPVNGEAGVPVVAPVKEIGSVPEPPRAPSIIGRATTLNGADCGYLEEQFVLSVARLGRAFKNDKSPINSGLVLPSDEEILAVLLGQFDHSRVEALKRAEMRIRGLVVTWPTQTLAGTEALMNANKQLGRKDAFISASRRKQFARQDHAAAEAVRREKVGLRFGFMELTPELPNRSGKLRDIISGWQRDPLSVIYRPPTHHEYGQGQAQTCGGLDFTGWSIFSRTDKQGEMYTDDGLVSGGIGRYSLHSGRRVDFLEAGQEGVCDYARVRLVVMGE